MKKFLSAAMVIAMLAMTVTGCSKKEDNSSAADSGSNSSVADSSTPESSQPEAAALSAKEMAANVLNAVEWPMLMPVADADTASFLGIDLALCEDYFIAMPAMSAHITEIIIVKPVDGQEAALEEAINNRKTVVEENGAFYPTNEPVVAGMVSGKTDSGYLYLIVNEKGQDCADAMMNTPAAELPAEYNMDASAPVEGEDAPVDGGEADAIA